jgi:hypothetical protein
MHGTTRRCAQNAWAGQSKAAASARWLNGLPCRRADGAEAQYGTHVLHERSCFVVVPPFVALYRARLCEAVCDSRSACKAVERTESSCSSSQDARWKCSEHEKYFLSFARENDARHVCCSFAGVHKALPEAGGGSSAAPKYLTALQVPNWTGQSSCKRLCTARLRECGPQGRLSPEAEGQYPDSAIMDQIAASYVAPEGRYSETTETVIPARTSGYRAADVQPEDHAEKLSNLLEQNCQSMRRQMMVRHPPPNQHQGFVSVKSSSLIQCLV